MRRVISLILNAFFLPFGYYYLKHHQRLLLASAYSLFAPFLIIPVTRFFVLQFGAFWPSTVLLFLGVAFWAVILWDTWRLSTSYRPTHVPVFYALPHALWFIPSLLIALFIAGDLRERWKAQIIEAKRSSSSAMEPTIGQDEYMYFTKVPPQDLRRGDIVVFSAPHEDSRFVSRIVALPGDRIALREERIKSAQGVVSVTQVTLNGADVPLRPLRRTASDTGRDIEDSDEYLVFEESLDGRPHAVLESPPAAEFAEFKSMVMAEEEYYLMADNRDNARDSRYTGPVPGSLIKGRYAGSYMDINAHRSEAASRDSECQTDVRSARCYMTHLTQLAKGDIRWQRLFIGAASHNSR